MSKEQQIATLVAVVKIGGNAMCDLIVGAASGDDGPNSVLVVRKTSASVQAGLLAQCDGRLDEGALYVKRDALASKRGGSMSFTGACWPGALPKM